MDVGTIHLQAKDLQSELPLAIATCLSSFLRISAISFFNSKTSNSLGSTFTMDTFLRRDLFSSGNKKKCHGYFTSVMIIVLIFSSLNIDIKMLLPGPFL